MLVGPQELFPDDMGAIDLVQGQIIIDERALPKFFDEFPEM
jgi:hypothetical protein